MKAYRISQCKYIEDLSGEGAFRAGGRWNSKGTRLLYTSTSIALSTLEILVHTDGLPIKSRICIIDLVIPDSEIKTLTMNNMPVDWDSRPAGLDTRKIGDAFVSENKYLAILVPSVIIPEEYNILINPAHQKFSEINISIKRNYLLDSRLKL